MYNEVLNAPNSGGVALFVKKTIYNDMTILNTGPKLKLLSTISQEYANKETDILCGVINIPL